MKHGNWHYYKVLHTKLEFLGVLFLLEIILHNSNETYRELNQRD